jgi:hypothetical protein
MPNVIANDIGLPAHFAECFQPLPGEITREDCSSPEALKKAFRRVLQSAAANKETGVVFVWAVEDPYPLTNTATSRVSYIEKTDLTIAGRWRSKIHFLVTDGSTPSSPAGDLDLVRWARESSNWSFYSQLIQRHGALRVWWASAAQLSTAASAEHFTPVQWEAHMLRSFQDRHGCLPAKNRKGSGDALTI